MKNIDEIRNYSQLCYDNSNCLYDGKNYFTHIDMVANIVVLNSTVFNNTIDYENTYRSAFTHDLLEDTKETWNNISKVCGRDVANITLAVTDVIAENRLMKHLLTMSKTVKDYRAIILKMADICANASYSKEHCTSMYPKYVEEYQYRKPIFQKALTWYKNELNQNSLKMFWAELDYIHDITKGHKSNN